MFDEQAAKGDGWNHNHSLVRISSQMICAEGRSQNHGRSNLQSIANNGVIFQQQIACAKLSLGQLTLAKIKQLRMVDVG